MQQTDREAAKGIDPDLSVTGVPSQVTPDLIQQLLEHDYLKLKIKAQVDEITTAKLRRWRAGLLGGASAAVVILGYLGIQANQIVSDFNAKTEKVVSDFNAKAEKVHALQDEIVAAQSKVDSASTRVGDLIAEAKDNAQRSTALVSSSQDFLRDNIKQLGTVNQLADTLNRKLTDDEKQMEGAIDAGRSRLNASTGEVKTTLASVKPLIPTMEAASSAAEEARKAGTFEIVFLESNSERTVVLTDYKKPGIQYRVRFISNRIKSRASLDVESAVVNGQAFPVQHLVNLIPGETRTIDHTSLQVEVSALRHHRQPFLHSFLILRVMSGQAQIPTEANKPALTASVQDRD